VAWDQGLFVEPVVLMLVTSIAAAALGDDIAKIEFFLGCLAHKTRGLFVRHKTVDFHMDLI
jgi:hypothetical protein